MCSLEHISYHVKGEGLREQRIPYMFVLKYLAIVYLSK